MDTFRIPQVKNDSFIFFTGEIGRELLRRNEKMESEKFSLLDKSTKQEKTSGKEKLQGVVEQSRLFECWILTN